MEWVVPIIVMPIPTLIAGLVVVKSIQVRKAARWVRGEALITSSKIVAKHHRFQGEATQVKNVPEVRYEFDVANEKFHGQRISIGDTPADGLESAMKRYAVGARVPVFYDPNDPTECVLERDPPVKLGCLWTGAAVGLLAGLALTFVIGSGESLDDALRGAFPRIEHPLMAICVASMGVVCLLMQLGMRLQAKKSEQWNVVKGSIDSSRAEVVRSTGSRGSRKARLYQAVVEYSYEIDGRKYRSTRISFGGVFASNSKRGAEEQAARYVPGSVVDVRVDPTDPTSAVLECRVALNWALILVGFGLLGVAVFAATHP